MFADNGRHMIAALFDGTVEQINYFPQKQATNVDPWKIMENQWATQRRAGVSVHVNIKVEFPATNSNNRRPTGFNIIETIGNNAPNPRPFIRNP